jgi:hypothetical protein
MTEAERLIGSIAYCGLICKLCFLADECDGCKTQNNRCDRNCSDAGCFQKQCCETKNLAGCWECDDIYACEEGIYAQGGYSKVKAFAICMKEDGVDSFIRNILRNMEKGWSVEKGKDYDGKPIAKVLAMIRG